MNIKQYKIKATVDLIVSVDEDKTNLSSVVRDINFDKIDISPKNENAEIVTVEFYYEVVDSKDDTILL